MSDLDADLYGDLYGNDETDFDQVPEEKERDAQAAAEPPAATMTPTPSTTTDPRLAGKVEPQKVVSTTIASTTTTTNNTYAPSTTSSTPTQSLTPQVPQQQGTIPSTVNSQVNTMPVTQKIPTYEQPQSGYRDSPSRHSVERTIRPSEMKDEG
ncbi:hypothetical protein AMATHDRAFT_9488 [Amanita thiersii Skay4041]|uniref:Uncharacterized protein n=1 Tax=Amanita thiersii Skay4041 TaxID=703135 RepID=A0A2A9N8F7_9AGAR|nr:hypothetical protein AMATHDRAFT_9488 [Amanita thiersii Skay4041]